MSRTSFLLHIAVSLFVAPTPALLVLLYLNGGGEIPAKIGLFVMVLSAGAYWIWLWNRRENEARGLSLARARNAVPLRAPIPQPDAGSLARPGRKTHGPSQAEIAARMAERQRAETARRSFQDIPDPLARGTGKSPVDMILERTDDLRQLKRLIRDHKVNLLNQWHRSVRKDVRGESDLTDWAFEADRFLLSSGYAAGTLSRHDAIANLTADIEQIVDTATTERQTTAAKPRESQRTLAFHQRCAITLQRHGWATHIAAEPRNDGIDLFGEHGDAIVGLHCRIYTNPVSEDIVRQVIDAAEYYCLDAAAIVSPSGFTKGARGLAMADRVALLDKDDLPQLHSLVSNRHKVVKLFGKAGG